MSETRPHHCPHCHARDGLWEPVMVQGWRSIDEYLVPTTGQGINDCDIDWGTAERDTWASMEVGCGECGWEGMRSQLQILGIDGKPLPTVHPQQMEIS